MQSLRRSMIWVILAMQHVYSAPLDEQKIYFPGEHPDGGVESRRSGMQMQSHFVPIQPYQTVGGGPGRNVEWSEDNTHNGEVSRQYHLEHPQLPLYGGYGNGLRGEYQAGEWGPENLNAAVPAKSTSYGISRGSTYQHLSGAHETAHYQQGFPHMPGDLHSLSNDALNGEEEVRKQIWSSQHSGETERHQHEPHQVVQTFESGSNGLNSLHGQTISSSKYQTSPDDLTSILDGQSSHKLHPNIKEALDHVIKDFGEASGNTLKQPQRHMVHKISHIKKTTVQNVGREPTQIHSTSSNDDINLSQLIEQLQMLEQSPQHINITWCEEKIKEFLRELRRKQASGVYINQQVQEQTLHQVLTHETSVENTDTKEGVYEPPMTRVTVKPLGGEESTGFIANEQGHINEVSVDQAQEGSSNHEVQMHESFVPEVLTVIPPAFPHQPEIMSHQYEQPKEVPPFISDNSSDLKELELELPEYVPFKHSQSGGIDAFEGITHKETRPLSHSSSQMQAQSEISPAHESNENLPQTTLEEEQSHAAHQEVLMEQQKNKGQHTSIHSSSNEFNNPVNFQTSREEIGKDQHQSETSVTGESNTEIESTLTQQHSKEENHEYGESGDVGNHMVHGRPQAPQEELIASVESSHEQSEHIKEPEQVMNHPTEELANGSLIQVSEQEHHINSHESTSTHTENLHHQQVNYDNLIEELIQLESIPGHQAIDKCEEKIQEFLEILKYQQEQGFGRNQQELERLHQTLIEQAQERSKQLLNVEETSASPTSFWRKVQKKIKKTYQSAKDRAKEADRKSVV